MSDSKPGWKSLPIGGALLQPGSAMQYKTGDWRAFRPIWDEKKCIHCMICPPACPDDAIPTKGDVKNVKRLETDLDFCKGCGICAQVCPVKCIKMEEEEKFLEK